MPLPRLCIALLCVPLLAAATPSPAPPAADALFANGDFVRAKAAYADDLARDPKDSDALLGLARIELYENHLDAATKYANAAGTAAARVLGTIAAREQIAASAAALDVPAGGVVMPFLESEPLPALQFRINGKLATFVLDTGAPDFTLDPDFAKELGLTIAGGKTGMFLGGNSAQVREAIVPRIDAGSITLHDVKVSILPSRGMGLYKDRVVDGVVGTAFLSRFLATIDYPHHRLILQPRSAKAPANGIAMPMWLVGDHFVFVSGSVNGLRDQLFNVDSGMTDGGFLPTAETIAAAHVKTFPDKAFQGMGGGGPATMVPIVADEICLGTACQHNVQGAYTPGGSPLAMFPFKVAGSVSKTFLNNYAVTFDFVGMQMVLTP
jgi:hypothetical protein